MEETEEELYREVLEAANYVSEHSMMHYDGRYQTTELVLTNRQAERRLDNTLQQIENIKQALEGRIDELDIKMIETGSSPQYVEKAQEKAEETIDDLENEIQHIREARESPPEEEADQEYVETRETRAETVADRLDYTPKREERK